MRGLGLSQGGGNYLGWGIITLQEGSKGKTDMHPYKRDILPNKTDVKMHKMHVYVILTKFRLQNQHFKT